MKKKLALTDTDAILDASIKTVMDKMKGERNKSRVTVCYLLADKHGKLSMSGGSEPSADSGDEHPSCRGSGVFVSARAPGFREPFYKLRRTRR